MPDVVQNDAERPRRLLVRAVNAARQFGNLLNGFFKNIRFVYARLSVQDAQSAFQPHARIDVFLSELGIAAVRLFIEAHKDVVPDFEERAAAAIGIAVRPAFGLADNEHFRVRSAGPRKSRGTPPIIFAGHEIDVFLLDPRLFPKLGGLVVAGQRLVAPNTVTASLSEGILR